MCLAAKMDDYLSKPFTLEQLRGILKRWLLERQASDSAGGSLPTSRVPINSRDAAETNLESTGSNGYSSVIDREALDDIRALQRPGMPDLVGKVINKYLSYSPTLLQALRQAASEGNAPAVQEAAHSLKSSSANLGATRLAAQCKELELLARANTIEPIQEHLHKLETEYEAVRIALSAELQESA
jgi:HPt (histidine-containing phosphotransfer) domain-containing protein